MNPYRIFYKVGKATCERDISLEDEEGVDVWTIAKRDYGDDVINIVDLATGKEVKPPKD